MNRQKREQLILDAAIRIFARQGYPKTSVSDIIDEAKVARGTFYLYFKSRNDLFHVLINRFMKDVSRDVAKINLLNGDPQKDLIQNIRSLASDLITTLTKNRLLAKMILTDSTGLGRDFEVKFNVFYDQLAQIIKHNLDQNITIGLFRPCASDVIARCMMGSVKELLATWIAQDHLELEPTIEGLINYLLSGLLPLDSTLGNQPQEEQRTMARQNMSDLH